MKKITTILFLFLSFFYCAAQVSITPSTDKGLCIGAAFADLGSNITIAETQNNAFTNGGTYEIRVPVNFEVENGSAVTNISGGNDITAITPTYPDNRTISLLFVTDATENAMDQFTITFKVRAVAPASFGTIVRSGGTNAANGIIHGVLSSEEAPVISGLGASYCSNNGNVTIYGTPSRGVFSGNGVTDLGNGSATFNPGAGGAGTVTFTVSSGTCQGVLNPSVIIKAAPFVSITSPSNNDFTTSSPPISLVGNPASGVFTGPAVSNDKFFPGSAGSGTHTITYTYTNGQGCTGTATKNLTVTQGGYVFPCLPAEICLNNATPIQLDGCGFNPSIAANQQVFDFVVYDQANGTWVPLPSNYFYPSNYATGYQYVGYRTCTNPCGSSPDTEYPNQLQLVYIKASGSEVFMYALPDLCLGSNNFNLTNYGYPAGGSFTSVDAPGAVSQSSGQYFFNPNTAGAGTFTVRYNPPAGACGGAVEQDITIYPTPYETGQQFTVSAYCYEDTLTLTDLTALDNNIAGQTNTIDRIYWYVDGSFNRITADHVLQNKFSLPGNHTVDVYVYSNNGCYNHYQKAIALGAYPDSDFEWENDCYDGTNPPTQFQDLSTISFGSITTRNWYFGDGAQNLGNNTTVSNMYPTPGKYTAKLVTISNTGCRDSVEYDNVNIYPVYAPASGTPYVENFRNDDGFWGTTGQPSSWTYGAITKSVITNNKNYWVTDGPDGNYLNAENSQLQSPCFDFTNLNKPMIALRFWSATPNLIAGTVLEYSTNDGATWTIVGDKGQGEFWYDEIGIAGSPGNTTTNVGWTGTYSGWRLARIGLSALANQSSVKFRFNFGAPNDTNIVRSDGFALDSVWIGERSHVVLLEHFTNNTVIPDGQNSNNAIDAIRAARRNDVAIVQYHTSFPNLEPYAAYNFSDPGSRVLYYGVGAVPRTTMDGNSYNGNIYSGGTAEQRLDVADIDYQALRRTNFDISINSLHNAGTSSIGVRARYTQHLPTTNIVMHTVLVEDSAVNQEGLPNNGLNGVVRKMLPDATGTIITTWDADSTFSSWFTYNYGTALGQKLGVVVFLQDLATKEVYQAAFLKGNGTFGYDIIDGVTKDIEQLNEVMVYPNPAKEVLHVSLPEKLKEQYSYSVLNSLGISVKEGVSRETLLTIPTEDLKSGMYTIQINSTMGSTNKKFLVE